MFAPRSDAKAVWHMLTSSVINLMLISLPIGIWAGLTAANPTLIFVAVGGRGGGWQGEGGGAAGPSRWALYCLGGWAGMSC